MRQNPHVRICGGPGSATTLVYPNFFLTSRGLVVAKRSHDKEISVVSGSPLELVVREHDQQIPRTKHHVAELVGDTLARPMNC